MIKRDNTFDVMKGIGIIAMVIGHSSIPKLLQQFIFVWHMPLFFMVSGYFYKSYPEKEYFKKNARLLLVPYIVTALLMVALTLTKDFITGNSSAETMFVAAIVGNGTVNNPTFSKYSIGAIWFLLAMFWCRNTYNLFHLRIVDPIVRGGVIITFSIIATYIGTMFYLPTDILQGFEALLFFYIGHQAKNSDYLGIKPSLEFFIIVLMLIGLSIYAGSMSMVRCYYGYWPINYLAAIGMTTLVYSYSRRISDNCFLSWCGRVSIVILCVHIIELTFLPVNKLNEHFMIPICFDFLIHLLVAIMGSYCILKFNVFKRLFCIK